MKYFNIPQLSQPIHRQETSSDFEPMPQHYQIILDSITDGVFTVDINWRIKSFNSAAEKMTKISRKQAIGRPCFEILRANLCKKGCPLAKTIETQEPIVNMPVYVLRSDNIPLPISITTNILKNSKGQVIGGLQTFRDLTILHKLRRELLKQHSFEDIVSKNERMLRLFSILPQIAESNSTVLIEGASGTGKEILASAIHHHSLRNKGPFVAVNCAALPDTLIESELFGYKAGAFTDAKKDKPGRFALAEGGTIFLDEIGDISHALQVRLLRVLEKKVYEPLGATESVRNNARVITATHRDLEKFVKEGKFREDLYFRINVIKLSLPKLSERKEDIPLLVDHFLEHFNHLIGKKILGFSQEAMAAMMLYDWPGNVRELENAIEYAFVLCDEELIRLNFLPERLHPENPAVLQSTGLTLREAEKNIIQRALERNQWKKVATARELGIDRNTLRRKIKHLGIKENT